MVVEAKDSYDVMLLPGDGIGPEITAATVNALEPLRSLFKLNFKEVRLDGCSAQLCYNSSSERAKRASDLCKKACTLLLPPPFAESCLSPLFPSFLAWPCSSVSPVCLI